MAAEARAAAPPRARKRCGGSSCGTSTGPPTGRSKATTCKHGKRPASASTIRLQKLQEEWAAEVEALKSLAETSSKLEARRLEMWDRMVAEGKRRPRPKRAAQDEFQTTSGMRFGFAEPVQPYQPAMGRSSRRTAYVMDYNGVMHTGPERHSQFPQHGHPVPGWAAAAPDAAAAAPLDEAKHAAGSPIQTLRAGRTLDHSRYFSHLTGRLAPHKMPAAGKPSQPPMESFKGTSCRRRGWYSDYSGHRILVDTNDMPSISWAG
eukprot:TRINITY_DN3245_c0_g1_i1.p1 TRINITY_DN3245_c0_g1~~TRINITY_DN3245_c0_g1_i1.p1  ORF type:complete len:262 (+),score=76.27 TRINITY_DN3245_c0_g1_i1:48-833(+)